MARSGKRNPYQWAGRLGVESGPVPIRRQTPHAQATVPVRPRDPRREVAKMPPTSSK